MFVIARADDPSAEHGTISLSAAMIANSVYAEKLGLQWIKNIASSCLRAIAVSKSLSHKWTLAHVPLGSVCPAIWFIVSDCIS